MSGIPSPGETFEEVAEEQADPSGGGPLAGDTPLSRLFDGDLPGPGVGELEHDYELPREAAIAARGLFRVATGSGVPPIFEILIGAFLYMRRIQADEEESTTADPGDWGMSMDIDVEEG